MFQNVEPGLRSFAQKQAIERKFFSWFDFEGKNINQFFALFGVGVSTICKTAVRSQELSDPIRSFLQLCRSRNTLVHNNYVAVDTAPTVQDTFANVVEACVFLEWLETDFVEVVLAEGNDA